MPLLDNVRGLEKPRGWASVYYSIPMYILIALLLPIVSSLVGDWLADTARSSRGLPAVSAEDVGTIGLGIVSSFLLFLNVLYGIIALVVGMVMGKRRVKRVLFNIGLIFLACTFIYLSSLHYQLVVDARVGDFSKLSR